MTGTCRLFLNQQAAGGTLVQAKYVSMAWQSFPSQPATGSLVPLPNTAVEELRLNWSMTTPGLGPAELTKWSTPSRLPAATMEHNEVKSPSLVSLPPCGTASEPRYSHRARPILGNCQIYRSRPVEGRPSQPRIQSIGCPGALHHTVGHHNSA